jgi:uncharacterized membrane protein YhhN
MKLQLPVAKAFSLFVFAMVCSATVETSAQSASAQMKVLFVGNSFTHGASEPAYSFDHLAIKDANGTGQGGVPGILKN